GRGSTPARTPVCRRPRGAAAAPQGTAPPTSRRHGHLRPYRVPPTPARARDNIAVNPAAHGPFPTRRRGRRPRRPFPLSTAVTTTLLQPLVGAGFHPRPEGDDRRRYGVALAA